MSALLWLLIGCDGGAAAPPPAAPPPATVAATAATPAAAPAAAPTIWTTKNIASLQPKAPEHSGVVPKPLPMVPAYDEAITALSGIVSNYAGDPGNPWAVAHGLLARGKDFLLRDGRPAIPHLFASYAEERLIDGHRFFGFPKSKDGAPVEPHTDLLLKNMIEAGVPISAVFPSGTAQIAVADLYRYTLLKTHLKAEQNHSSFESPNDIPWGLQALAAWSPEPELQWVAADGTAMDLDYLTDFQVAVLMQETAFMYQKMQRGEKFERSGQPLFGYTCGGAHILQGASYAVARGFGSPKSRTAIQTQIPLMFYRLPIELSQYQAALKRNPSYSLKLTVQTLKFLGHFLETMSKLSAMGFYIPDENQQKLLETAAQNLVLTVQVLQAQTGPEQMAALRKNDEQLYLDVIGDSAHALRGLELALGRGSIAW